MSRARLTTLFAVVLAEHRLRRPFTPRCPKCGLAQQTSLGYIAVQHHGPLQADRKIREGRRLPVDIKVYWGHFQRTRPI